MFKTSEEVDAEVAKLRDLAPRIRQEDAFGGNNRRKIDLQIEVLTTHPERDEDDWRRELESERDCDYEEVDEAIAAIQWREGEESEAPSEGWEGLAN